VPEDSVQKYLIRDTQGNVYGPADAALLRDWVAQGRIVAGMFIAERETRQWIEASEHFTVADLLATRLSHPAGKPASAMPVESPPAAPVEVQAVPVRQSSVVVRVLPATATPADVQPFESQPAPRQNVVGVISLVASLAGAVNVVFMCLPICACVAAPLSGLLEVIAVVLAAIALFQIREDPTAYKSRGIAMAGLVIGLSVLAVYGLVFLGMLLFKMTH
jgi:hypothetical protein